MNKKFIIACSIVVLVLAVGLCVVSRIYFGARPSQKEIDVQNVYRQGRYGLISAVPTDALGVACAGTFGDLLEYVSSPENSVAKYINRTSNQEFFRFCDDVFAGVANQDLKGKKAIVSFDYNGAIRPLLILDYCRVSAAKDASGDIQLLKDRYPSLTFELHGVSSSTPLAGRALLYVSTEGYLVSSAIRNIERGHDITSANGFVKAALACSKNEYLIVANSALGKFFKNNLESRLNYALDFLKTSATWLTLCPKGVDQFSINYTFTKGKAEYFSMYGNLAEADCDVVGVIPGNADFVVSVPMAHADRNIEGYKDWFDYNGNIMDYKRKTDAFVSLTANSKKFTVSFVASSLEISSVSLVQTPKTKVVVVGIGKLDEKILFPDEPCSLVSGTVYPFAYKSLASVLCGDLFSFTTGSDRVDANRYKIAVQPDLHFTLIGNNLVISDKGNLQRFMNELEEHGKFFDVCASTVPAPGRSLYVAMRKTSRGDVLLFEGHKSKKHGQEVTLTLRHSDVGVQGTRHSEAGTQGTRHSDAKPSGRSEESRRRHSDAGVQGTRHSEPVEESRVTPDPSVAPLPQDDVKVASSLQDNGKGTVNVPTGPYKVKLSNGKTVSFATGTSGRKLTFKNEAGASQWTVSLPEKVAGKVEVVDFYKNGKQQFVFIAGNRLYIIDRLSHYLKGFPKTLQEKVVLGPRVYDFNNNKKYNILVLTENNTIEMYNLKGEKPAGWQGIAGGDKQIVELPVRRIEGGKTQWIVKFSDGTSATYGFNGGKAL